MFSGTREVLYYAASNPSQYMVRTFIGGAECSNRAFGVDPAPGDYKECSFSDMLANASGSPWTPCANEGGHCTFSGTHEVRL